jgi:Xaa-Pro aminopeptidase
MLLNRDRAYEVMDSHRLDALLVHLPVNVYYFTDHYPLMSPAGWDYLDFALLPRDPQAPAALIVPCLELFSVSGEGCWVESVIAYSAPAGHAAPENGEPAAAPLPLFPRREGGVLSAIERRWLEAWERWGARPAASGLWGVARALRDAGLEGRRIGLDNPGISAWLAETNLGACEFVPARSQLHEIRMIKSQAEIALLKRAATINEAACLAGAAAIHDGGTHAEVETAYMAEMCRRGGRGIYIVSGLAGLPNGVYRRGEPVMVDALGAYRGYHGDIGRTIVIGEPSAEVRRRMRALATGWQAAVERIRPGLLFSELVAGVAETVRAAGFPEFGTPIAHSVGLTHTDDPAPVGAMPGVKPDKPLAENMVINVDMPHVELGWGSVHIEDTVRITADGCEPLTSMQVDLITRPA